MKVIKSINIDQQIWEMLERIAKEQRRSKSNMIEILIKNYKKDSE